MDTVLDYLGRFKYLAMFGILFMCGLGFPLPEEVTLVGSGLFCGWDEADFVLSSIACVLGILAGDSVIFGMGYLFGHRFLNSRPMKLLLRPARQRKVGRFFRKHGNKAIFFARFFAGVRVGVYAYAGSQRVSWFRFLFLDFLGAILSGPTSIWVGKWAATKFAANKEEAAHKAMDLINKAGHWIVLVAVFLVVCYVGYRLLQRRLSKPTSSVLVKPPASTAKTTQESGSERSAVE